MSSVERAVWLARPFTSAATTANRARLLQLALLDGCIEGEKICLARNIADKLGDFGNFGDRIGQQSDRGGSRITAGNRSPGNFCLRTTLGRNFLDRILKLLRLRPARLQHFQAACPGSRGDSTSVGRNRCGGSHFRAARSTSRAVTSIACVCRFNYIFDFS